MLLRHSAVYLFARGVPGLLGFATVMIFTRLLSPEAYGRYALVITGATIGNAILYKWLSASLLRFLPQYRDNEAGLLNAILNGFVFVSFLAGTGGTLLILTWDDPVWRRLILIGIFLLWAQAWFSLNLELVRSRLSPIRYGLINMLKAVVALGLGVVLVLRDHGPRGALAGLLIGFFVAGIWASRGQWMPYKGWRSNRDLVKKLMSYGLPLTMSFALAVIISSTDRFMLAGMIDESATGLYAAGQWLAGQAVGVLMTMVSLAAYPLILQTLESDGADAARDKLRKNAILLLGIGLPVATVFIVLAPNIAKVFLGQEFQLAGTVLMPWFAVATLLSSTRAYYFDLAFYLGKRTRSQMMVMGLAALVNVGMNLWLIPVYGLLGAVYASVAAHSIAFVLSAILGRFAFRLPVLHGEFARLLFATSALALVLCLFQGGDNIQTLAFSIASGGVIYLGFVFVLDIGGARESMMRILAFGVNVWKGISIR